MSLRHTQNRRELEQNRRTLVEEAARLLNLDKPTLALIMPQGPRGRPGAGTVGATGAAGQGGAIPDKGCRIFNDSDLSAPNATDYVLSFNSERWDTDTMHNPALNPERITINTAGVYVLSLHMQLGFDAGGYRTSFMRINGATIIGLASIVGSASLDQQLALATIWKFAQNDYVEALLHQTSGITLGIQSTTARSPEFAAQLIA
jgi:hypothetical protein